MTAAPTRGEAPFRRGERVVVEEPGIRPIPGLVGAAKFSRKSGWWIEVRRDDDGKTWSFPEARVRLEVPTTVDGLVARFEQRPDEPAGPGDLFDRLREAVGDAAASRLWSEACEAFDRKHAPEEFGEEEE